MASNRMSPGRMRGWVDFIAGIPVATKFKSSVRVGAGTHTAFDGSDGVVVADGASAALVSYNRDGTNTRVAWLRDATGIHLNTEAANLWVVDTSFGLITQAALTTLVAGTSITLGGAGTQGSRLIVPTYEVYVLFNLTVTAGIAAGATIATIAAGNRPATLTYGNLVKNALGAGTYTALPIDVTTGGLVQTLQALANTDVVTGTMLFMTV